MKNLYKKFFTFFVVPIAVYGFNTVNSVYATKLPEFEVNPILLENCNSEDLRLARNKMSESFEKFGVAICSYPEIQKDIQNDIQKVVSNGLINYRNFVDEKIREKNLSKSFELRVKNKVGSGSQAVEFLENWKSRRKRNADYNGKSAKQIFVESYSFLSAYKDYLNFMYDSMIAPVEETLDTLYEINEYIKNIESEYLGVKYYTLEIDKVISSKERQLAEAKLKEKMDSMDFKLYEDMSDFCENVNEYKRNLELKKVEEEIKEKKIEEAINQEVINEEEDDGILIDI